MLSYVLLCMHVWFGCIRFYFNCNVFGFFCFFFISLDRFGFVFSNFVLLTVVFFCTEPRDWLGRTSPKWPILCRLGRKTLLSSVQFLEKRPLNRCSSSSSINRLKMPSVLWHCWLGVRKSIRPVKVEWWVVGVVICLEWGVDRLHMVQMMPLPSPNPIISCLI